MIKLKNLWKIALAAMTMSAMLVACDTETSDKSSSNENEDNGSASSIYSVKLLKDGIAAEGWGAGGGQETIKLVLAPKSVVQEIKDEIIVDDAGLFIDAHKCYVYANNDVDNGRFTSATVTEGTYVQPANYEEYTGVAITKDAEGNYIVKVDMTKIDTSILLAKGAAETNVSEKDPWGAVNTLATDYVPMVLGSVTAAADYAEIYDFGFWNAGVAIGEPTTEAFPTNIVKEPKAVKASLKDMKVICSNFGNVDITFSGDVATAEITYALANNTWKQTELSGIEFGVCSDTSWGQKFTGAVIEALDTEVALTFGAGDNNKVSASLLKADATYVITINAKNNTVKVSEK